MTAASARGMLDAMDRVPTLAVLLRRAWRLRCPACGRGPVFARGIVRAPGCGSCGRRLDRDEGHWLGGMEVHMVLCFGTGTLLAMPLVLFVDLPGGAIHGLAAVYLAASAAFYRPARALFLALDFAVDPSDAGPPGPRRDPDDAPARGPTPAPRPTRRREAVPV